MAKKIRYVVVVNLDTGTWKVDDEMATELWGIQQTFDPKKNRWVDTKHADRIRSLVMLCKNKKIYKEND